MRRGQNEHAYGCTLLASLITRGNANTAATPLITMQVFWACGAVAVRQSTQEWPLRAAARRPQTDARAYCTAVYFGATHRARGACRCRLTRRWGTEGTWCTCLPLCSMHGQGAGGKRTVQVHTHMPDAAMPVWCEGTLPGGVCVGGVGGGRGRVVIVVIVARCV